jgi:hypothetical protein
MYIDLPYCLRPPCLLRPAQLNLYEPESSNGNAACSQQTEHEQACYRLFPTQIQSHISGIINDEKVYGREEVLWEDIPPFLAGYVQFILIFSLITTLGN